MIVRKKSVMYSENFDLNSKNDHINTNSCWGADYLSGTELVILYILCHLILMIRDQIFLIPFFPAEETELTVPAAGGVGGRRVAWVSVLPFTAPLAPPSMETVSSFWEGQLWGLSRVT